MPIKNLFFILALTSLGLAGLIVWGLMRQAPPPSAQAPLFLPSYAEGLEKAASLTITYGLGLSGTRHLHIVRDKTQWRLGEKQGYRANQELVYETLIALAELEKITAQQVIENKNDLGLTPPEDLGSATRFVVKDETGGVLVSVLLGREERPEAAHSNTPKKTSRFSKSRARFYMQDELADKKPEKNAWLVAGRLPRNYRLEAWLDPYMPHYYSNSPLTGIDFRGKPLAADIYERHYNALRRLRPDHVVDSASLGFKGGFKEGYQAEAEDTLVLSLHYQEMRIDYYIKTTAAHIWVVPHITASASADSAIKAQVVDLQKRYGGWALRFAADTARLWLPYNY